MVKKQTKIYSYDWDKVKQGWLKWGHQETRVLSLPVWPLLIMNLMAEEKLIKAKSCRVGSIVTWLVSMSTGDWRSCPQKDPDMPAHWVGPCSVDHRGLSLEQFLSQINYCSYLNSNSDFCCYLPQPV